MQNCDRLYYMLIQLLNVHHQLQLGDAFFFVSSKSRRFIVPLPLAALFALSAKLPLAT